MYWAGDIGVLLRLARCIPYSSEDPRLMAREQPHAEGVRPDFDQPITAEHLGEKSLMLCVTRTAALAMTAVATTWASFLWAAVLLAP
jgi:hypothetical protein